MYRAVAAAAIALTASFLIAQNQSSTSSAAGAPPRSSTLTISTAKLSADMASAAGCPVSIDARQGVWDHTMRVHNGQDEKVYDGIGQRLSLTLLDTRSPRIVAATVKVVGLSGQNRMLNTAAQSSPTPDLSRIIRLTSFTEAKSGMTAELYAPGFTSVTSIQLLEVTYADGSNWSNPDLKICRVSPDPLMLVAAH